MTEDEAKKILIEKGQNDTDNFRKEYFELCEKYNRRFIPLTIIEGVNIISDLKIVVNNGDR